MMGCFLELWSFSSLIELNLWSHKLQTKTIWNTFNVYVVIWCQIIFSFDIFCAARISPLLTAYLWWWRLLDVFETLVVRMVKTDIEVALGGPLIYRGPCRSVLHQVFKSTSVGNVTKTLSWYFLYFLTISHVINFKFIIVSSMTLNVIILISRHISISQIYVSHVMLRLAQVMFYLYNF